MKNTSILTSKLLKWTCIWAFLGAIHASIPGASIPHTILFFVSSLFCYLMYLSSDLLKREWNSDKKRFVFIFCGKHIAAFYIASFLIAVLLQMYQGFAEMHYRPQDELVFLSFGMALITTLGTISVLHAIHLYNIAMYFKRQKG